VQKIEKKESLTLPVTTLSFPLTGAIDANIMLGRNVKISIPTNHKIMIREFTVFCKLNLISLSTLQIFEEFLDNFRIEDCVCPICGAKHACSYHDDYERCLISYESRKTVYSPVNVPRGICESCGHTHAILPEIIIPYRSYSILFILTVLRDYYIRSSSVQELCNKYQIAISTLYLWKRLFNKHKILWLGLLEDAATPASDFLDFLMDFSKGVLSQGLKHFFLAQDFSFLQGISKTARYASP